ncbi:hypothetical protein M8494_22805 [Serratia ureilytica]
MHGAALASHSSFKPEFMGYAPHERRRTSSARLELLAGFRFVVLKSSPKAATSSPPRSSKYRAASYPALGGDSRVFFRKLQAFTSCPDRSSRRYSCTSAGFFDHLVLHAQIDQLTTAVDASAVHGFGIQPV